MCRCPVSWAAAWREAGIQRRLRAQAQTKLGRRAHRILQHERGLGRDIRPRIRAGIVRFCRPSAQDQQSGHGMVRKE